MMLNAQTFALITIIGGFVTAPVTSLLKHENWTAQIKQLVALGVSMAVTAASIAIVQPHLFMAAQTVLGLLGVIYTASQALYQTLFSGTTVNKMLTKINLFGRNATDGTAQSANPAREQRDIPTLGTNSP
jgi:hypothetical protein